MIKIMVFFVIDTLSLVYTDLINEFRPQYD